MSKKLIFFSLGTLFCIALFLVNSQPNLIEKSHAQPSKPRRDLAGNQPSRLNPSHSVTKCTGSSSVFENHTFPARTKSLNDIDTSEAYTNPSKLIVKAQTDPDANIKLFNFVSSCFPNYLSDTPPPEGCPDIRKNLAIRTHPIELLQKAAEQGSQNAKLMYVLNVPTIALQYRKKNDLDSVNYANALTERAEQFGRDAARSQEPLALRIVSVAYEKGYFGKADAENAYVFSLPLQRLGTEEDRKRLQSLALKLTPQQRLEAEKIAYGCDSNFSDDVMANPFQ